MFFSKAPRLELTLTLTLSLINQALMFFSIGF
jgi:hypothetical protein